MDVTITREIERLERRLTFLATVGSTAPFIGLFGTVWGIMTSFQAIAVSKNTSLAVVAPGIAEALFATALGLLAAIPAVIFYNKFNSEVARHAARLEGFADEFAAILSRQIDKSGVRAATWEQDLQPGRVAVEQARAAPLVAADERDQRHADGRRHARAAHHLHGDGADADGRHEHGSQADLPKVDLPKTEAGPIEEQKQALAITVDPDGKVFLQNSEISFDELVPKLTAIRSAGAGDRVVVQGRRPRAIWQRRQGAGQDQGGGHSRDARHRAGGTDSRNRAGTTS